MSQRMKNLLYTCFVHWSVTLVIQWILTSRQKINYLNFWLDRKRDKGFDTGGLMFQIWIFIIHDSSYNFYFFIHPGKMGHFETKVIFYIAIIML